MAALHTDHGTFRGGLCVCSVALVLGLGLVVGCAETGGGLARAWGDDVGTRTRVVERPAVLVDGRAIGREYLDIRLAEAAGETVVREAALDTLLRERIERRGITLDEEEILAEAALLERVLVLTGGASADQARLLVADLRRVRGLGDRRWRDLLVRNASLRALVRAGGGVEVSEEDIRQAYELRYGKTYRVRVVVVGSISEAGAVRRRVLAAGEDVAARAGVFAGEAVSRSEDPTAARGGLIERLSLADPRYPSSVRALVAGLEIGEVSEPSLVDSGVVVVFLEDVDDGGGADFAAVRDELRAEVVLVREREAMDQLRRGVLERAGISVLDETIRRAVQGTGGTF